MNEDMVYICNGTLLSHKKKKKNAICGSMDGPGNDHTKRTEPEKEKYCMTSVNSLSHV